MIYTYLRDTLPLVILNKLHVFSALLGFFIEVFFQQINLSRQYAHIVSCLGKVLVMRWQIMYDLS